MIPNLAGWLSEFAPELLPRWAAALAAPLAVGANGSVAGDAPAPAAERALPALYRALIDLAAGQADAFDRSLSQVEINVAFPQLPQQTRMLFALRRAAAALAETHPVPLDQLHTLIDETVTHLAEHWSATAESAMRDQQFVAESLAEATEQADRIAIQLSHMNEVARLLASSLDSDALVTRAGDQLHQLFRTSYFGLFLLEGQELVLAYARGSTSAGLTMRTEAVDGDTDVVLRALHSGTTQFQTSLAPETQGPWYIPGCAVLAVPLMVQSNASGVLVLQDPAPTRVVDRTDQELISTVASQVAVALENAQLYAQIRRFNSDLEQLIAARTWELQQERDRLEALYQIALEVSSSLDLSLLLENSLSALARITRAGHGSIMLVEQDTGQLVDRELIGTRKAPGYTRFAFGQGIVGWVAQSKKPAMVPDVSVDERWVSPPDDNPNHKRGGSIIAVPLIAHDTVLGVLQLSHEQNAYFNADHLRLLTACAGQIAIGIYNAMLYDQIEQQYLRQGEILRRQELEASQKGAILQSLADGVIVCDVNGFVLLANSAAERILERRLDELVTWNLSDLIARLLGRRADKLPLDDLMAHPFEAGHARMCRAVFTIGPRTIDATLGPVAAESGGFAGDELIGAVMVLRDITREVESDRLKTEFIGTVSHELRTPMTSIKGYTQLLTMGSLGAVNDTQREFLTTIQNNAERMIQIINDLLDITKFETGSVDLTMQPLHLAEAISSVLHTLSPLIKAREHRLTLSLPPGLPLVRSDGERLHQVLYNLVSNAVKYTPRGGQIEIRAREAVLDDVPAPKREQLSERRRYVQIDVVDTGVGINPGEQDLIFERFYRTENPLKVEAGGTGLGLALVKPLVSLLGGVIWLKSTVGEGSTFSLVIPAA